MNWEITKLCDVPHSVVHSICCDNKGSIYFVLGHSELWSVNLFETPITPKHLYKHIYDELNGIVSDGNNSIFLCRGEHNRIVKYNISTNKTEIFAGSGVDGANDGALNEASFCKPRGINMDNNGDLYVTDDHHIRKINMKTSLVETIAGSTTGWGGSLKDAIGLEAKFNTPTGLDIAPDGTIYVCDTYNRAIRKLQNGVVSTVITNEQMSTYSVYPQSVVLLHGCLLMVDYAGTAWKIHEASKCAYELTINEINYPRSLARDAEGNIYIGRSKAIYKLKDMWIYKRLLWIGQMKEDACDCPLASLPSEIIYLIGELFFPSRPRKDTRKIRARKISEM